MSPNTVGVPVELTLAVHGSDGPREERKNEENTGSLITYMAGGRGELFAVVFVCFFEIGPYCITLAGLELIIDQAGLECSGPSVSASLVLG